MDERKKIAFTCAHTPLPVIDAAGFSPYRILPMGDFPDQAGGRLHDNLCPHVKKVLDIGLADAMPEIAGMVLMNSCDAMRRLADAWRHARPDDRLILLDMPATADPLAVTFFAGEIKRLSAELSQWSGAPVSDDQIMDAVGRFNHLSRLIDKAARKLRAGEIKGGAGKLQEIVNLAFSAPMDHSVNEIEKILQTAEPAAPDKDTPRVFLFGNVMPDPGALAFFESCGLKIVGDDLCTGARMFNPIDMENPGEDVHVRLAKGLLSRTPCPRTFFPENPGSIADQTADGAKECGAEAVIGHTLKFCDPYIDRLPIIRKRMKEEGFPLLLLEGDCSLRSAEQHRTRIEAFVEMLR
ncbi:conserved hypothetical protein [Candidatus Desulfarcum epimagneticum]|uniref:2-hydroxyacyl-CoA dehydratase n=1 Tax=uncultured Desulfobacteraceae bacterium TaxID=218296 RepID=A0A484HJ14_9BACT|nr:conserved hypothetical protein [uncultured Desulfobacteraceae bacterium]